MFSIVTAVFANDFSKIAAEICIAGKEYPQQTQQMTKMATARAVLPERTDESEACTCDIGAGIVVSNANVAKEVKMNDVPNAALKSRKQSDTMMTVP
jgi:hypothetical protein